MTSWPILFTLTLKALFFIPPLLASDDNILSSPDLRGSILDSVEEFCQWETFNATCSGQDKVVLMSQARYGRMKFGRCVKEDHGSVGCFADVLRVIDEKCSGRRSCTVGVPDATLHNTHPCPKELMPYLEASYLCVTASTWKYRKCTEEGNGDESSSSSLSGSSSSSSSSSASSSSSPSGSSDTLTGGVVINLPIALNRRQPHLYGKDDDDDDDWTVGRCPWIVQVPQGQRINLTLFTFSRQSASPQQTNQHSNNRIKINTLNGSETAQVGSDCYLQLTILESGSISHNVDDVLASPASSASDATIASLCLSGLRQTNVYQSHSNRLEVSVQLLRHYHPGYNFLHANHINHTGDQLRPQAADVPRRQQQSGVNLHTARFMLRYEALGCPDLLNVTNADVRRNGGNVSIKCLFNSDTFYITCKGNTWIGERLACPGGRYVPLKSSTLYTYGVLTAIGLAVALMVSCVVVIAFSTVAFVRKRSSSKSQNNPIQDPLLKSPATRFKKDINYESSGDISDKRICRYHYHQQQQHSVQHGENSCEQLDTIDTCNTPDCLLQLRKTEKQSLLQQQHLILCRDDCNFAESGFGTSHGSKIFCNCATDYSNVVDCRCCGCNLDATTKVEFGNDPLILYSSFGKTTCNAQRTLANACGNSERQLSCRQQLQPRACYCVNMDDQRHPDHAMLQAGIVSLQHVHKNLTTNSIHQQQQRGEFVSLDLIKDYGAARTDMTPGDLNETTFSGGRTCPNSSTSGQSGSSVVNITVTNQVANSNSSYTADDRNINPEL